MTDDLEAIWTNMEHVFCEYSRVVATGSVAAIQAVEPKRSAAIQRLYNYVDSIRRDEAARREAEGVKLPPAMQQLADAAECRLNTARAAIQPDAPPPPAPDDLVERLRRVAPATHDSDFPLTKPTIIEEAADAIVALRAERDAANKKLHAAESLGRDYANLVEENRQEVIRREALRLEAVDRAEKAEAEAALWRAEAGDWAKERDDAKAEAARLREALGKIDRMDTNEYPVHYTPSHGPVIYEKLPGKFAKIARESLAAGGDNG